MPVRIYWLTDFENPSRLGIMPRPRGNDWLEDDILSLKRQGVETVVSLLEEEEIYELGLKMESELCLKHGIEYIHFPITDRNVPKTDILFYNLISQLKAKISAGNRMVLHCRMGIGRSTILAVCLLFKPGFKTEEAIEHIGKIRGMRVPDTDEQVAWLKKQEAHLL